MITASNLKAEISVETGEPLRFECTFLGLPRPSITWYKNDELLSDTDDGHIMLTTNQTYTSLEIKFIKDEDGGNYCCEATNRNGSDFRMTALTIQSYDFQLILIIAMFPFVIVLIVITLYLRYRMNRQRKVFHDIFYKYLLCHLCDLFLLKFYMF